MFYYEDAQGAIGIDWAAGKVASLRRNGIEMADGEACPIFSFRLRLPSGEAVERNAFQGRLIELQEDETGAEGAYGFEDLDGTVVRLRVRLGGESWMAWRIALENRTQGAVEWTDFPQIPLKRERDGRKASFYWPYMEGTQVDDIELRERSPRPGCDAEFPFQGVYGLFPGWVESQFVAYELGAGLCLAAHDEKRGLKNIDFLPLEHGARLKMRIYAGAGFGADYALDYDVAGDFFEGGWIAATELYRRWNDRHLPEGLLKIGENPALPEWYGDAPVVVTYPVRGLHDTDKMEPNRLFPYEKALPHIDRLAEKLNCRIMVLLMHWEGTAPWTTPFVWPPYGGEEMFLAFMDKLHARGHLLGVYLSGIGWTEQSVLCPEYNCEEIFKARGYKSSVCLSPQGEMTYSQVVPGIRKGYDLCAKGKDTASLVIRDICSIAMSGVDYAQILDQNLGGNQYMCYSREHGHAPVPGPWTTEAMRDLLTSIHGAAPHLTMGCEAAASEPYIPHLPFNDNRFLLAWSIGGKPVPMYAYLYHEYLNNFMGNQCGIMWTFNDHENITESLLYRLAYSYAAGDMGTLIITDDGRITQGWCDQKLEVFPDQEQVTTLVRNLNALRRGQGKKYLHQGRMLAPHPVEGAGTFTLERTNPASEVVIPRVVTSRWQAQDGDVAQVLINWTNQPIRCRVQDRAVEIPALNAVLI